jgi:hypothetical protein
VTSVKRHAWKEFVDAAISQVQEAGATEMIAVLLETEPGAKDRTLDYLQGRL